jgi:hypothetical protein
MGEKAGEFLIMIRMIGRIFGEVRSNPFNVIHPILISFRGSERQCFALHPR